MPKGLLRSGITAAFDQELWQALQIQPAGTQYTVDPDVKLNLMLGVKKGSQGTPGTPAAISAEKDSDGNIVLLTKIVNFAAVGDAHWLKLDGSNANQTIDIGGEDLTTLGTGTFGDLTVDTNTLFVDKTNHRVGIGTVTPTNILHIKSIDNIMMRLESTDAKCFFFVRDSSGGVLYGAEGAVAVISNSAGNSVLRVAAGIGVEKLAFMEKSGMSRIGGFMVQLTNETGSNSVAGQIVKASTTTDDAFALAGVNELMPIGTILENGVSDGSEAWIVVSGIADVLVVAAGCVRGDRLITAAVGGFATVNNAPSVAVHFQEIGHCIETRVGAGLARVVLHFL